MWFKQCVAMNIPVNEPLMKQNAADLAREMNIVDWEAGGLRGVAASLQK